MILEGLQRVKPSANGSAIASFHATCQQLLSAVAVRILEGSASAPSSSRFQSNIHAPCHLQPLTHAQEAIKRTACPYAVHE